MDSPSSTPSSQTPTDRTRRLLAGVIDPATAVLQRLGVRPNAVTVAGLLLNAGVGLLAAAGQLTLAGIVFLVSGLFDGLDGALARRVGNAGRFGAFLDSTLDRYSEAFVLFGLLVFAGDRGMIHEVRLAYVTLAGSLLISYTRARAEALRVECKVGLLTRLERYLLMAAMLILQQLTIGLLAFAILTHFTAVQRIVHVWRVMRAAEGGASK